MAAAAAEEPADVGSDGGRIARWHRTKHLIPCAGCVAGEAMALDRMFKACSLFTFGHNMGVYPRRTNLTLVTNETVLVHLVGSRLFFPDGEAFFSLLTADLIQNRTCPGPGDDAAGRMRNITSLCAVADPADGTLRGGVRVRLDGEEEEGPLCVIYGVEAAAVGAEDDVGGGRVDRAAGLYGPGEYDFDFSAFRTGEFRYAFWSIQFLSLEEGGGVEKNGVLRANVTSKGSFVNDPPALPKPLLVNAFFIAALVVCAIFFVRDRVACASCVFINGCEVDR